MRQADRLLLAALDEDLGHGDVTTEATVDPRQTGTAVVVSREPFILSGTVPFQRMFQLIDARVITRTLCRDGEALEAGREVLQIEGPVRAILAGERTALNLLQRLCGVATLTRKMADAIADTGCRLLDTRKTTPLWRAWEKAAVRHGGGCNHRFGLYDGVLIKDNHVVAAGGVGNAVRAARRKAPHTLKIEVEVDRLEQLDEALEAGADIVLLDNFSINMLQRAVAQAKGKVLLEASGGITLETIRQVARTGVDFISSGALTHSAPAIDLSLELRLH